MIFISYSTKDREIATELYNALIAKGYMTPFIDYHTDSGIPGGSEWERELRWQLKLARGLVVLCSENWKSSDWCREELGNANAFEKPIIPLNIDGCTLPSTLARIQQINFQQRDSEAYDRLWRAIDNAGIIPGNDFYWPRRQCPYPGLAAFEEGHAGVYFGRERELEEFFTHHLNPMRESGKVRLVFIIGPSGSGKSSFVRAGVLPRLRCEKEQRSRVLSLFRWSELRRDGQLWGERLATDLLQIYRGHPNRPTWTIEERINRYAIDETPNSVVAAARRYILDIKELQALFGDVRSTPLIILDQCEELLSDKKSSHFLQFLGHCLSPVDSPCRVIATVRSDFLGLIQQHGDLLEWNELTDLFRLDLLKAERLYDIVRRPTEIVDVKFESDALINRLVAEARTSDALPLLEFTLRRFYETGGKSGLLTLQCYEEQIGGLDRCLQSVAEVVFKEKLSFDGHLKLPDEKMINALRSCFVQHLVQYQEGTNTSNGIFLRRQARWSDLPPEAYPLLERMASPDFRLLSKDQAIGRTAEEATVEVTHEALFRVWPTLTEWLNNSIDGQILRQRIEQLRLYWVKKGGMHEDLCPLGLVTAGEVWETSNPYWFTEEQHAYLSESGEYHQHMAEELVRLKVEAELQDNRLMHRALMAESRRLAILSESERITRWDRALLLAATAYETLATMEARDALYRALTAHPEVVAFLAVDQAAIHFTAYSPDGKTLAVATSSGVILLDPTNHKRKPFGFIKANDYPITSLAFHPNSSIIAVSTVLFGRVMSGTISFYDTDSGRQLNGDSIGVRPVQFMAFAANSEFLIVGSYENIILVDVSKFARVTGELYIQNHGSMAYENNAKLLAIGADTPEQTTVMIFDLSLNEPLPSCNRTSILVEDGSLPFGSALAFSPNGKWLAVGLSSNEREFVRIYEVPGWKTKIDLPVGQGKVRTIKFHPDSNSFFIGYENVSGGGMIGFDLVGGDHLKGICFVCSERSVKSLDFDHDGNHVAIGCTNFSPDGVFGTGSVALIHLASNERLGVSLPDFQEESISIFTASQQGNYIAVGCKDKAIIYDAVLWLRLEPRCNISGTWIDCMELAPDDSILAIAYRENGAKVEFFDAHRRQSLGKLSIAGNDRHHVTDLIFRADGKFLAVKITGGSYKPGEDIILVDVEKIDISSKGPFAIDTQYARGVALHPDYTRFAVGASNNVVFFDSLTRNQVGSPLTCDASGLTSEIVFSPDGETLAVAFANTDHPSLWLYSIKTQKWQRLSQGTIFGENVDKMIFSPDSRKLAVHHGGAVLLYDATGEAEHQPNPLVGLSGYIERMIFSNNGKLLAIGFRDGSLSRVMLYYVTIERPLQSDPLIVPGVLTTIRFLQDDSVIAVNYYGEGKGIIMWDIDGVSWTRRARAIANRQFNQEETLRYNLDNPS